MKPFTNRAIFGPIFFYFFTSLVLTLQADESLSGATPADTRGLKISGITTRSEIQERESENICHAFLYYFDERKDPATWFNEEGLKEIHQAMFGEVWKWAGIYYDGPPRNIGMSPSLTAYELRAFCEQVVGWRSGKTSLTPLQQSVRILHRLVQIHPFYNGNGRFARFVANLYLFSLEDRVIYWPEKALQYKTPFRQEYVQALKKADKGDYDHLEELVMKYER